MTSKAAWIKSKEPRNPSPPRRLEARKGHNSHHVEIPYYSRKPRKTFKLSQPKDERVLIWGGGSSVGFYAVQIAAQAGYKVITTASKSNELLLKIAGTTKIFDYHSPTILQDLLALGPYKAIFGASESAADQITIGKLLVAQGRRTFLSTMGVRAGVILPDGVKEVFVQFMDDYLRLENAEFVKWVF
ncbi:hypothetical protein G7Y89_g4918 [Cudoniella acicularis]|uniref:Alcohol dehydrogenase-like C-terminal domain-containing protein n=1 Tax=Cudoniella acicularis TaxID=354080 RepID=A0A8H4RNH3_9HELO|nr:hypothetical protein G7Y89_g4918 [Cudoniella acicularis]